MLDYLDMPLAENTRRNVGLRFTELMEALGMLLSAPKWAALTVCEVNPEHGESEAPLYEPTSRRWPTRSPARRAYGS